MLLTEYFICEEGGILFYFLFFIGAQNSDEGGSILVFLFFLKKLFNPTGTVLPLVSPQLGINHMS